ncbi:MAG: protein-glutamate O-methyltransferase CheR [Pseudomonadota bacterium]
MVAPLTKYEFNKMRDLIVHVCGIAVDDDKDYLVETRLTSLAQELGAESFGDLHRIAVARSDEIVPRIIDLMTTNETFWFRDENTWDALEHKILPELFDLISKRPYPVRIWSMAASTGQEPYSLAMLIEEIAEKRGQSYAIDQFKILATDISKSVLFIARAGKYNKFAMGRGMSDTRRNRFFEENPNYWKIRDTIKNRVMFQEYNLLDAFSSLGSFDMILCRNVAIYFPQHIKKDMFKKIARTLQPDSGILILGSAESLVGYSEDYITMEYGNAVYYKVNKTR